MIAFQTFRWTTLSLDVVDQKNFTTVLYFARVQNLIFAGFCTFSNHKWGERGEVAAGHILVSLESPIYKYMSIEVISKSLAVFSQINWKLQIKRDFRRRVTSAAPRWINRSRTRNIPKLITPNQTRGVDLSNEPVNKNTKSALKRTFLGDQWTRI